MAVVNFNALLTRADNVVNIRMECKDIYAAIWLYDKLVADKSITLHMTKLSDPSKARSDG